MGQRPPTCAIIGYLPTFDETIDSFIDDNILYFRAGAGATGYAHSHVKCPHVMTLKYYKPFEGHQ